MKSLVFFVATLLATSFMMFLGEARGQSGPVAIQLTPNEYLAVEELRQELALTNRDLAAMGVSEQTVASVLGGLLDWYRVNQTMLATRREAERDAIEALRTQLRSVEADETEGSGPSLASLRSDITQSNETCDALVASAVPSLTTYLTGDQAAVWAAARSNQGFPLRYRYVPDVTEGQLETIGTWNREPDRNAASFRLIEDQVFTGTQIQAMNEANARLVTHRRSVAEAVKAILPEPEAHAGDSEPEEEASP